MSKSRRSLIKILYLDDKCREQTRALLQTFLDIEWKRQSLWQLNKHENYWDSFECVVIELDSVWWWVGLGLYQKHVGHHREEKKIPSSIICHSTENEMKKMAIAMPINGCLAQKKYLWNLIRMSSLKSNIAYFWPCKRDEVLYTKAEVTEILVTFSQVLISKSL